MRKVRVGPRRGRRLIWLLPMVAVAVLLVAALVIALQNPSIAANGADFLRSIIGDKAVASLETALFTFEDAVQRWEFRLGLVTPTVPWAEPTAAPIAVIPTGTATLEQPPVATLATTAAPTREAPTATPTPTPTPSLWLPPPVEPMGSLPDEGVWSVWIQDASGRTVGYRTYLQPDKDRPLVLVDVVAFDLAHTRLHYVLGTIEPYSPDSPKRSGRIADADRTPGLLLAMFNGGFKAIHGHFGAMADGIVALPPKPGLGTLAIYGDGSVRLGAWGTDITPSPDITAYRQNGPLMIDRGVINPAVNNFSPQDWGYTIKAVTPTLRSGIGLSADGKTLYYACGPFISVETLALAMQRAGASEAIQLDINWYWVLFVAVRAQGNTLNVEPLDPKNMTEKDELKRYLGGYSRDYFYVTGLP
jgi:hypothetical protein